MTDEEFAAWLEAEQRKPIATAEALGHQVEADPPAGITAVERWTCKACGMAVLRNREVIYGSAATEPCQLEGGAS